LVEGLEDIAYITAWLAHTDRWDDFRRSGHLQTSRVCPTKSALPLRADIEAVSQLVGFGPILLQKSFCITEHNFSGL
jgi:hypothetical protein